MTGKESVEGYCVPLSVEPGQRVALHAAATQRLRHGAVGAAEHALHFGLEVARIGAERHVVKRVDGLVAKPHDVAADAYARGAEFPALATIDVGRDFPSGYYEARLRAQRADGTRVERCACFVVRPAASFERSRPLLVLATNTWNAYNDWGGANLHTTATHVSFLRPFAHGLLDRPDPLHHRNTNSAPDPDPSMRAYNEYLHAQRVCEWSGSAGFASFERPFIEWAERAGYDLDYATSADLERYPELLQGRRLYLSVGHDQDWSSGMRDNVEAFIARGGNALFLSGSTCFWQVRYADGGATLIGYRDRARREDPIDQPRFLTSIWSDPRIGRPETTLTGLTFTRGGYHRTGGAVPRGAGGYTIWRPKHWLFAGTDLHYGDLFGAQHGIVGYQCDGCALALADGLPVPTGEDGCPAGFEVLGTAPARLWSIDEGGNEYPDAGAQPRELGELRAIATILFGNAEPESVRKVAHGNAVLGAYTAGGTVVSCGSTDWVYGLAGGDPLVQRVTRNALDRLSR